MIPQAECFLGFVDGMRETGKGIMIRRTCAVTGIDDLDFEEREVHVGVVDDACNQPVLSMKRASV